MSFAMLLVTECPAGHLRVPLVSEQATDDPGECPLGLGQRVLPCLPRLGRYVLSGGLVFLFGHGQDPRFCIDAGVGALALECCAVARSVPVPGKKMDRTAPPDE